MPQDPFKVDQLQIEPGSEQTLTIGRRASDGSLFFVDTLLSSGVSLSELAGLRSLPAVYVVAPSGAGAEYTTISEALDEATENPALILVCPGSYSEDPIEIQQDGVSIVGLGSVTISPNADADTITLSDGVASPLSCVLQNLIISNENAGRACVRVTGGAGSTIGNSVIQILDCALSATDAAGYVVRASSANHILVRGGDWAGSNVTATTLIEECASFTMDGVLTARQVQLDYDGDSAALPDTVGNSYKIVRSHSVGVVSSTLENDAGSLLIKGCGSVGDVTLTGTAAGTQDATIRESALGALTVNDGIAASIAGSSYDSIAGAGTLETDLTGTADFTATDTVSVTFDVAQPDANYVVSVEFPASAWVFAGIGNKTAAGFDIGLTDVLTAQVSWSTRRM